MRSDEYQAHDATALADLIARREVMAAEVVEAALARLAEVNPRLNAVTLELGERALEQVKAGPLSGPLGGVPFLLKDLSVQLAGTATTAGSRLFGEAPAASDSALVAAYKQAGLVVIGKTNTPEMGLEPVTEPDRFGPTRNPWNLERTPGGSSGGAAAAVAAGIVPAAHASDGGGSIRIPAAASGLFGMKPSRGRVSFAPADEGWGGFSIHHAVSWSVRDSATLLDIACQPQPGDPYWLDPPATPFAAEVDRAPGRLKVAVFAGALAAPGVSPDCVTAVRAAGNLVESLGHEVEEVELDWRYAEVGQAAGQVVSASVAAALEAEAERRGRPIAEGEIEPVTLGTWERGKRVSGAQYVRALQVCHAFGRKAAAFFERFDVLLTSTLGSTAIPIGALRAGPPEAYAERLFAFMPNTQAFNITGQPAMSVPLATGADGLPIGVQFVGRTGEEGLLFRLAGQLEQAAPWKGRRPPM